MKLVLIGIGAGLGFGIARALVDTVNLELGRRYSKRVNTANIEAMRAAHEEIHPSDQVLQVPNERGPYL